jgi:hypothetical protein
MSLLADSSTFVGNGFGIRNYTTGPLRDTLFAMQNSWGSVYGPLDTTGSVELPEDPTPSLDAMRNTAPVGQTGDRVSEGVLYYPWIGESHPVAASVVASGWNLMSLARRPPTFDPVALFPLAVTTVFGFNNLTQNTEPASVLDVEHGYWVKFDSAFTSEIAGGRVDSISVVAGAAGWILVGSLTEPLPASSIATTPANAISTPMFRFNRTTQLYEPAVTITPGEGYWIKVDQPCTIHIR